MAAAEDTEPLGVTFSNKGMASDEQNQPANDLRRELLGMLNTHRQEVHDALEAHRSSLFAELQGFASRLQATESELADLRANGGGSSNRAGHGAGMMGGMTSREAFERLRSEMRQEIEIASIKAGYLAVAASACDDAEKQRVFQTLKAKEQALKDSTAGALVPFSGNEAASLASGNSSRGMNRPFTTHSCYGSAGLSTSRDGVEQPFDFEISLDRSNNKALGVKIDGDHDRGRSLLVETVKEGLVQDWNESCPPDKVVQPGDVIVAVNGEQGDSARLLAEAGARRQLRLRVRRAAGPGGLSARSQGGARKKGSEVSPERL